MHDPDPNVSPDLTVFFSPVTDSFQMISAEAPVLFAKAAEIFITEISLRAWIHTEDNKRRTLQRNDIAMAISKYDQFDFLIDIVPREELKPPPKRSNHSSNQSITLSDAAATVPADQVQYILQQAGLQQHATGQPIQILQTGNGLTAAPAGFSLAQQLLQIPAGHIQATADGSTGTAAASGQVIQLAGQPGTSGQAGGQHLQIVHQMNGDVSQIPISLNQQQLQMIRMQLQGQTGIPATQPILIQAPAQSAAAQYQLATQSGQFFLQTGGASGPQAQTVDAQETQSEVDETE